MQVLGRILSSTQNPCVNAQAALELHSTIDDEMQLAVIGGALQMEKRQDSSHSS